MLNISGLNNFYYIRNFTDMRCKYDRVLSIVREQLHREPNQGDVFIMMSKNRRLVRMFMYDKVGSMLFEKKFHTGYQFMKVVRTGDDEGYRINWKDVVLLLENDTIIPKLSSEIKDLKEMIQKMQEDTLCVTITKGNK